MLKTTKRGIESLGQAEIKELLVILKADVQGSVEVLRSTLEKLSTEKVKIPKLLNAYLSLGAKICGAPAIDTDFKTIDFLTLMDLAVLPEATFSRFSDAVVGRL